MKKTLWLLIFILCLPFYLQAKAVDSIAAIVNDEIITALELDIETAKRAKAGLDMNNSRAKMLDVLIEEKLIGQRVKELGLKVSPQEIESAINDVQSQNKLSREQLIQALQMQGIDFSTYKDQLKSQIIRYKLVNEEVQSRADVLTQEIKEYYELHQEDYKLPPYVRLAHISLPLPDATKLEKEKRKVSRLRKELTEPMDFLALLEVIAAYPEFHLKDMGKFEKGQLSTPFSAAIEEVPAGGVSDVINAFGTLHLLYVLERNENRIKPMEEVKDEIHKLLRDRKVEEKFKNWSKDMRKNARIEIK